MDTDREGQTNEEEVLRQRLTNDNEGNGEEKRINAFIKSYLAYLVSEKHGPEADSNRRKLYISLDQFEHHLNKNMEIHHACARDQEYYDLLTAKFKDSLEAARQDILSKKEELEVIRTANRTRHEYNILCQNIKKCPDPKSIESRINELEEKKSQLTARLKLLHDSLESYKQDYNVCINSLLSLRNNLEKLDIPDE
ncbi:THO complex subunit 7 [Thelohanellus kitauei]|uniref:THO complex subunit 7 n=1 Tax=Thelohanellus kitauei TaxID=669202 RepID=A0A0C2MX39_THEKT|nr:THO complex subunit 7 [Thelohanellus kitauei]